MRKLLTILAVTFAAALPLTASAQNRIEGTRPGWLGVNYDVTIERRNGVVTETVTILDVIPGSPADRAGLKTGHRIVRVDGKIVSGDKFELLASSMGVGDTIRLRVADAGREFDVAVVATPRPFEFTITAGPSRRQMIYISGDSISKRAGIYLDSARGKIDAIMRLHGDSLIRLQKFMPFDTVFPGGRMRIFADTLFDGGIMFRGETGDMLLPRFEMLGQRAVAGAEFEPISPDLAQYFGTDRGLLVLRVSLETVSGQAGLKPGDVVTRAGDRSITTIDDLRQAVTRASGSLTLDVLRKGKPMKLELPLRIVRSRR